MLNNNKERELAYIVTVDAVEPIEGYDRIAYATVNGWHCVVGIDMKAGDKAIYFEIDSLLPSEDERFAFCQKYNYKVKTQRYCKGTRISQGLLLPLSDFPEFADKNVGDFVTKELGVTYYDPMDRARKSKGSTQNYKPFFAKIKRHFPCKQLLRTEIGRKILFTLFGVNKKKKKWPDFIPHSDEERINNMTWILNNKSPMECSEKIDGSSASFGIRKGLFGKFEYFVCSRNVVLNRKSDTYYADNIWFEVYDKYHIKDFLTDVMHRTNAEWCYLGGEVFGKNVQKRDYSIEDRDFRAWALCTSNRVRYTYKETEMLLKPYGIPTVPIINDYYVLPDTIDEVMEFAHGTSMIDGKEREGIVFRSIGDPTVSFKAVDPEFIMKYHG